MIIVKRKLLLFITAILLFNVITAQTYRAENVTLLSHWDNPNQPAIIEEHNQKYSGCWGWTDTIKHKEYAIVGSVSGTYFIDVTDPYNPVQRDFLEACNGLGLVSPIEIKSFSHYLYISAGYCAENGFQIVDMQFLPDSIHLVNDTFKYYSHTLYIDEVNARLYLTGVRAQFLNQNYYSDLDVFDISNPEVPILQRRVDTDYPNLLNDYSHDCYARNDTVYLSAADLGYYIFTQTDTMPFQLIGSLTNYPNSGYNHSSWLTDNGRYAILCEEQPKNVIKVLDLQDVSNIDIVGSCISNPDTSAIHHNPFVVGNDKVVVACYSDGLQIFDFSDPENPTKTGYFDTFYQNDNDSVAVQYDFRGCWGAYPYLKSKHVLALDMQNGLYVLDANPALDVNEIKDAGISVHVFPNPTENVLTVSGNGRMTVKLYDVLGHLVLEEKLNSTGNINAGSLPNGLYMLVAENRKNRITEKVIISR